MNQRADRPPGDGFEIALVAIGGTAIVLGFAGWLGASLAALLAGGRVTGDIDVWLTATVRLLRGQGPAAAWADHATALPSTWLYWTCTAVVSGVVVGVVVVGWRVWRRLDPSREARQRFGQPTDAREANRRDVAPLVVESIKPPEGRMLLGRLAGTRTILATEDRNLHTLKGRAARRQGNRGSVALIGPTGSGKTALAASAIATWDGPVVAVSVKRDLYDVTAGARADRGEIAVFDPGGATGLPTARWSPLRTVDSSGGALRVGRALAQAIPRGGVTNPDYWAKHGEKLLGAFMSVAGLATRGKRDLSMQQLATWVTTMAGATEPTINELLRWGLQPKAALEAKLLATYAATTFTGIAKEDHKIRSSIYSTAALALDPWLEPAVAHSASASDRPFSWSDVHWGLTPRWVDLEWLDTDSGGHSNTLYLTAQQPEFERLSPVLGGLLADLKDQIHAWDIAGRRLRRPLLFVIDEAGQLELGWLPAEVSTIAALGAFFVTCWQSLSQMQHRHHTLADTVLAGHRTKCFFAGIDDLATSRYLTHILGHEQVTRKGWSHDTPSAFNQRGGGRRSVSVSKQREEFAPANAIRQMIPGEAVMLHGTLPPVHLEAVRWWNESQLSTLVNRGPDGEPVAPAGLVTCPLTSTVVKETGDVVTDAALKAALSQLPEPTRAAAAVVVNDLPPARRGLATVALDRAIGRCELCSEQLGEGEGRIDQRGGRRIVRCAPSCTERRVQRLEGGRTQRHL